MRSISEVSNYINSKGYYDKSFDYAPALSRIIETLKDGEEIIFACASSSIQDPIYAYKKGALVITNERLIYSAKTNGMFIREPFVKAVSTDFVSDITNTDQKNYGVGCIEFDCRNERFGCFVMLNRADEMYADINNALDNSKSKYARGVSTTSAADELKKFKELLDMGAISQEEFDAKKKQLLGL